MLLGREEISERLGKSPEEIFRAGSHAASQLRPAGYDLRLSEEVAEWLRAGDDHARDDAVYAGQDGRVLPKRANVNRAAGPARQLVRTDRLMLNPGDIASLASYERFCMPWDVSANIGVRYHAAQRGLLVFTGLLIDPGFGLEWDARGWVAADDARLRFVVANISDHPIELRLGAGGDVLLSLQFFSVKANPPDDPSKRKPRAPQPPASALAFFEQMRETRHAMADLKREQDDLRYRVEVARGAMEQIVLFGVFLLLITALGICLAIAGEMLDKGMGDHLMDALKQFGTVGAVVVACVAIVTAGVIAYRALRGLLAVLPGVLGQHRR